MDIGTEGGTLSLAKLVGYAFFLVALLWPRIAFARPPTSFWFFLLYLCLVASLALFGSSFYVRAARGQLQTLAQLLVLWWISSNLLKYERVFRLALISLASACVLLAILQLTGVAAVQYEHAGGRISSFGDDPNTAGSVLSLGLVTLVGLAYGRLGASGWSRWLALSCFGVVAVAITRTGSRGAAISLAAGLAAIVLGRGSLTTRVRNLTLVILGCGVIAWLAVHSDIQRKRWSMTLEAGSMAGRETIYPAAWRLFLERPVLGWGPARNVVELGKRLLRPTRDTHNLYLWVLTEAGLLGGIPYFIGLFLCVRAAWKARRGARGGLPLAMLTTVLMVNVSLTWQYRKLYWFSLGVAAASGAVTADRRALAFRRVAAPVRRVRDVLPGDRIPQGTAP